MIRVKLNIGFCASLTLMCLLPNTISLTHHIKFCTGNNSMPNKHWHVWGCESAVTHHSLTGLFTDNIKFIFPEIRKASDKLNLGWVSKMRISNLSQKSLVLMKKVCVRGQFYVFVGCNYLTDFALGFEKMFSFESIKNDTCSRINKWLEKALIFHLKKKLTISCF